MLPEGIQLYLEGCLEGEGVRKVWEALRRELIDQTEFGAMEPPSTLGIPHL